MKTARKSINDKAQTEYLTNFKQNKEDEILSVSRQIEHEADKYALIYMMQDLSLIRQ
ncbi:MAG: hypothetical protein WCK67_10510 [bacterium]